jgi:chromosome segregation ATPase
MASEPSHPTPVESGDFILATYREIALRFQLGGPNAARTKVKRAGWISEPPNHPADPLRIKVPRDAWHQAVETPTRNTRPGSDARDAQSLSKESGHIKALESHLAILREEQSGHLAAREAHIATLRDQLALAEGRALRAEERADQVMADLRAERAVTGDQQAQLRDAASKADHLQQTARTMERVLREAETGLTAERAARAAAEAEATRLLTDLRAATQEAETEALAAEQARTDAAAATEAAEVEVAELRHALEQARAEVERRVEAAEQARRTAAEEVEQAIREAGAEIAQIRQAAEQARAEAQEAVRAAEAARAAAQTQEPTDRPSMVASRIDEVQLRRLQEAEQARKSRGRWARLKAAWRGE